VTEPPGARIARLDDARQRREDAAFFKVTVTVAMQLRRHFGGRELTTARAIYDALCEVANQERNNGRPRGEFEAHRGDIAVLAGVTKETLDKYTKRFESIGVLGVDRRRVGKLNLANIWTLAYPGGRPVSLASGQTDRPTLANPTGPGVADPTGPLTKKEKKEKNPPQPPAGGGSSGSVTIWESYVTDRGRSRRRRVDLAPPSAGDRSDWDGFREVARNLVGESTFAIWFDDLDLIAVDPAGGLVVNAGRKAEWLRTRFCSVLERCPRRLRLVGDAECAAAAPAAAGDDVEQLELPLMEDL
jgi:hypothetical protein